MEIFHVDSASLNLHKGRDHPFSPCVVTGLRGSHFGLCNAGIKFGTRRKGGYYAHSALLGSVGRPVMKIQSFRPPRPQNSPTRVQARLLMHAQISCTYRPVSEVHSKDARAFR